MTKAWGQNGKYEGQISMSGVWKAQRTCNWGTAHPWAHQQEWLQVLTRGHLPVPKILSLSSHGSRFWTKKMTILSVGNFSPPLRYLDWHYCWLSQNRVQGILRLSIGVMRVGLVDWARELEALCICPEGTLKSQEHSYNFLNHLRVLCNASCSRSYSFVHLMKGERWKGRGTGPNRWAILIPHSIWNV